MAFYNQNPYTYDPCYYTCDEFQQSNFINYSTSLFSDPKTCHYDPNYHYNDGDYYLAQTRYMVSYSEIEKFNEDDFFEYDPTPYGGGYDLDLTYGKALPPSDKICYPISGVVDKSNNGDPARGVSSDGVLALPFDENKLVEEESKVKMDKARENGNGQEEETHGNLADYTPIWSDFDSGHENTRPEDDFGYQNESQMIESQSGHGSNGMDLCEILFGYRPSLSQQRDEKNKSYGGQIGTFNNGDANGMAQWNGTAADYLFGSLSSYDDLRIEAGMYDNPIFGYEKHYQEPLQYEHIEYDPYFYECSRIYENEV